MSPCRLHGWREYPEWWDSISGHWLLQAADVPTAKPNEASLNKMCKCQMVGMFKDINSPNNAFILEITDPQC